MGIPLQGVKTEWVKWALADAICSAAVHGVGGQAEVADAPSKRVAEALTTVAPRTPNAAQAHMCVTVAGGSPRRAADSCRTSKDEVIIWIAQQN